MPRIRSLGQVVPRNPPKIIDNGSEEEDSLIERQHSNSLSANSSLSRLSDGPINMVPLVSSTPLRPGPIQVAHLEPISRLPTITDNFDALKENDDISQLDNLGKSYPAVTRARKQSRVSFALPPSSAINSTKAPSLPPASAPSHLVTARLSGANRPLSELDLNNHLHHPHQLRKPASDSTSSDDIETTIDAVRKVSLDSTSPAFRSPSKVSEPTERASAIPHQRLTIHKLVLTNFKSYAGRQEIGPFHSVRINSVLACNLTLVYIY